MAVHVDIAWIVALLLVSIRLGALFVLTPLLGGFSIPVRIRVFAVLALSVALAAGAAIRPESIPAATGALLVVAAGEALMGAILAFALFTAFGAFLFAGRLLDLQIGFGIANLIDPITRSQAPLLGTALYLLAALVFLAIDGHHVLIRMFAFSLERHPPGLPLTDIDIAAVAAQFGVVFAMGVALVAPVVVALLLLDVALALVSRTMPQMNVFIVAIPLKVVVGLVMLAITVQYMSGTMGKVFGSAFGYWQRILGWHG